MTACPLGAFWAEQGGADRKPIKQNNVPNNIIVNIILVLLINMFTPPLINELFLAKFLKLQMSLHMASP
jgi:hypothetical protein